MALQHVGGQSSCKGTRVRVAASKRSALASTLMSSFRRAVGLLSDVQLRQPLTCLGESSSTYRHIFTFLPSCAQQHAQRLKAMMLLQTALGEELLRCGMYCKHNLDSWPECVKAGLTAVSVCHFICGYEPLQAQSCKAYAALQHVFCPAGHTRFATTSIPNKSETHPHQWTPSQQGTHWKPVALKNVIQPLTGPALNEQQDYKDCYDDSARAALPGGGKKHNARIHAAGHFKIEPVVAFQGVFLVSCPVKQ